MIREQVMKHAPQKPTAFRWRGGDVSRLEGLSDAVFGFAITLLVVSLEVPKTFSELAAAMRGFGGFAVCFALLALVWYDHYIFFRQYGLKDTLTVVLNLFLLFVVMFYVYPLKFLFTLLANVTMGTSPPAGSEPVILQNQMGPLMIVYGSGFVAIYVLFTMMYLNAYRQREELALNELEAYDTRATIGSKVCLIAIGLMSIIFAASGNRMLLALSGPVYFLIGFAMFIFWSISGSKRRRLEKVPAEAITHNEECS
jgi:uncharacterized membrane protein